MEHLSSVKRRLLDRLATKKSPYKKLNRSENQLRIAILEPCSDTSQPIRLTLETASLGANPDYEALSYRWGDDKITAEILINNIPRQVTTNLHAALQAFRRHASGLPVRLWIDAVCINQQDEAEKLWQVTLMCKVYSQAKSVRTWLGPSDFSDQRRLRLALFWLRQYTSDKDAASQLEDDAQVKTVIESLDLLADIFRNQYWRRRWITQEIVLARRQFIYCGDFCADVDIRALHQKISSLSVQLQVALPYHGDRELWGATNRDSEVWKAHQPYHEILNTLGAIVAFDKDKPVNEHPYLLRHMRGHEQGKENDSVYGLLGLLERDFHSTLVVPDYSLPIHEVLQDFTFNFMTASKSLAFLYEAYPEDRKLPTWVPDLRATFNANNRYVSDTVQLSYDSDNESGLWSSGSVRTETRFPDSTTQRRPNMLAEFDHLFNASASSTFFAALPATGILHVCGLFVDTVADCAIHDKGNRDPHPRKLMDGWTPMDWTEMDDWATRYADTPRTDRVEDEALLRTLCADTVIDSTIHTPQIRRLTLEDVIEHRRGIDAQRTNPGQISQHPDTFLDASMSLYKFFCTKNGTIGITFADVQKGDMICVVASLNMPLLIRGCLYADAEDREAAASRRLLDPAYKGMSLTTFKVVGACYVHGIMDGEAIQAAARERGCSVEEVFIANDLYLI